MNLPIGIRQNNPLNLRYTDIAWSGKVKQSKAAAYEWFESPEKGIRAAAKNLQTYAERDGLKTIREIVSKWAPKNENDTASYITAVGIFTDFDVDESLDLFDFDTVYTLMRAMTRQENGKPHDGSDYWYPPEVWERGLRMAGLSPNKKLVDSRTMKGAATATAGMAAAIGVLTDTLGIPDEIANLLPTVLQSVSEQTVAIVMLAIGLIGPLYTAYARRDDKLNGRL